MVVFLFFFRKLEGREILKGKKRFSEVVVDNLVQHLKLDFYQVVSN